MNRLILVALFSGFLSLFASAQSWPSFPLQDAPITTQDVINYWTNKYPRPVKPRSLDRSYKQKFAGYRAAISQGRSLIQRLRNGAFDEDVRIAVLRHNRDFYLKKGNHDLADSLSKELAAILETRAAIARAEAAEREAAALLAVRNAPPIVETVEEVIYVETEEECPPPKPTPKCPPPSDPPVPCPPPPCPVEPPVACPKPSE